jgi:hypothetical protein
MERFNFTLVFPTNENLCNVFVFVVVIGPWGCKKLVNISQCSWRVLKKHKITFKNWVGSLCFEVGAYLL